MIKWIQLIAIMLLADVGYSQNFVSNVSKVGTSSAPFLTVPIGPRAISMGGAFVALSDDASALYWNPSGITRLDRNEFVAIHSEWIAGINHDFGAIVFQLGSRGTLGLSIISITMDEMEVRTELLPEGTGEFFSANDMAIGATYAKNLTDRFSIGFTGKYIFQKIWHAQASGFAMDFGTLFKTDLFNGMRIGAVITNFGQDMKIDGRDLRYFLDPDPNAIGNNDQIPARIETDGWPLPLNFQFGLSTDIINSEDSKLTISIDALHPSDNYESINLGTEYTMNDMIFLRGGYRSMFLVDSEEGISLGAGLKISPARGTNLIVDYSYQDFGRFASINSFALSLHF